MINRFVIAEANKCIGCRTCEIACTIAHAENSMQTLTAKNFMPRLKVIRGMSVTTPVLCRQCDNAPCASVCPTGAIVRNKESIQVIQERCIGCKTCAIACPFGAMTVVSEPASGYGFDAKPGKSQALKCDLCIDNPAGPACINVCPTKALRLVGSSNLDQLILEKQQRTALEEVSAFLF